MFQHNWELNTWKTEQGGYLLDETVWLYRQKGSMMLCCGQKFTWIKRGEFWSLYRQSAAIWSPFLSTVDRATARPRPLLCAIRRSQGNSLVLQPWLTSILMPTTTSERLGNKKASWLTSRVFWKYCFHCLQNYHQRQQNFSLSLEANRKSYILTEFIE